MYIWLPTDSQRPRDHFLWSNMAQTGRLRRGQPAVSIGLSSVSLLLHTRVDLLIPLCLVSATMGPTSPSSRMYQFATRPSVMERTSLGFTKAHASLSNMSLLATNSSFSGMSNPTALPKTLETSSSGVQLHPKSHTTCRSYS